MLSRSITDGQVSHAYLFSGPESIGKRATALAFAAALNCLDPAARAAGDSCGVCRACKLIALGQHPDVRLFTPETTGGKTVIPIDAIRTKTGENSPHPLPLREDAQLKPLEGRWKVYILDPANRPGLQEEAGNALLLTLEEPPPHVVLILISSRPSAVLPTLVSRCRPIRFKLAARDAVMEALSQRASLSHEQALAIASMAGGRIGWALSVAAAPALLDARAALFEEMDRLIPCGRAAALRLADILHRLALSTGIPGEEESDDGKARTSSDRQARRQLPELIDIAASWWRDLLVYDTHPGMCINVDFSAALGRHAGRLSPEQLRRGVQAMMRAKRLIERNANLDLALEQMWMAALEG